MQDNLEALRALCFDDLAALSPFQIRTRFERHLYGLLLEYSRKTFGFSPTGLSRTHINDFRNRLRLGEQSPSNLVEAPSIGVLESISDLYEKFTRLCDTSHWSDDGQDPRINLCRDDILRLCDSISASV